MNSPGEQVIIAEWVVNVPRSEWDAAFGSKWPRARSQPRPSPRKSSVNEWTPAEIELLYSGMTAKQIKEETGRSINSIYHKRMRLKRDQ